VGSKTATSELTFMAVQAIDTPWLTINVGLTDSLRVRRRWSVLHIY